MALVYFPLPSPVAPMPVVVSADQFIARQDRKASVSSNNGFKVYAEAERAKEVVRYKQGGKVDCSVAERIEEDESGEK